MNFDELNKMIPYALWGKEKSLEMKPYKGITLALPGRHALDTEPPGGDFVVMVTDKGIKWNRHQFTHSDLFGDIERRYTKNPAATEVIISDYANVILGQNVEYMANRWARPVFQPLDQVLDPMLFLTAVQCLAVAEHRRYHRHEKKFGGRYLPFRFAAGIAEGLWTAAAASNWERKGRQGVEALEGTHGVPSITTFVKDELK